MPQSDDQTATRLNAIETGIAVLTAKSAKIDWYKRILDTIQAVVVIGGVGIAIQQLIEMKKTSEHTAYNLVSSEWIKLDRHFIEKTHLRPYFFEGLKIERDHPKYAEVDATAHYVLNFLDYAISTADHLDPAPTSNVVEKNVWHQYVQKTYFSSPIVCENLQRYREGYSKITLKVADRSCTSLAKEADRK